MLCRSPRPPLRRPPAAVPSVLSALERTHTYGTPHASRDKVTVPGLPPHHHQRPEPPHRDPEPAKMSCQTYLTRGERRTRGSNENRNVCFVELSVTACGVVVRLMPPSELARRALYDLHDELTPPIVEALLSIRGAKIMSTHIRQGEHCLRDKCSDLLARRLPSEGSTASSRARRSFDSTVHLLNGVFDVVRKYTHGPVEGEVRTTQIEPTSRVFCDLAVFPAGTSSARVRMQLSVRTPSAHTSRPYPRPSICAHPGAAQQRLPGVLRDARPDRHGASR